MTRGLPVRNVEGMRREEAFPKLENAVALPSGLTWAARATLDPAQGREAVSRAVHAGLLRPYDIASADVEEPRLMWVPFWRMDVSVDGFFVNVSGLHVGKGDRSVPVPTGGSRYRDAIVMICAREAVPYVPKLPSLFGRVAGVPALEIAEEDLERSWLDDTAEVVDADVTRSRAEAVLVGLLLGALSPTHVLYPKYEPKLNGVKFCLYPLYYARYTYSGEARRRPGEELFVLVSARTGEIVAAKHPSAARAVAAKVRRLLSFDWR